MTWNFNLSIRLIQIISYKGVDVNEYVAKQNTFYRHFSLLFPT